jgi:hypothetical protein
MRFEAYVIFMLCIAAVFYMIGLDEPLVTLYDSQDGQFVKLNSPDDSDGDNFFNILIYGIAGSVAIAAVAIALITGYSAMFIIPLIMVFLILNFFVFPFSSVLGIAGMPEVVGYLLVVFFNGITVLALMSFIRGRT